MLKPEEVDHVATLARLDLTAEERQRFAEQLGAILDYVDQLKALDTSGIEATLGVQPRANVFRADEARPSLSPDEVLANAPRRENDGFRIPRILEEA